MIAVAADHLCQLRETWANPNGLVRHVPEVVGTFPGRLLPVDNSAAQELKIRTMNRLYTDNPIWLQNAHRQLDEAVAAAYGCSADISDEEILRMLLSMNHERGSSGNALRVSALDDASESEEDEE